jgi:predicted CXXCH cytochrome family protein
MKHTPGALIGLLLLLVAATQASTIEHPGILPRDANCSSCHANKTRGKSVHSAMAIPCTVCHLAETQGDMTTLNLVMPKEKICFACHEKSAPLPRHSPAAKAPCVECHDSHSSSRPALLREQADVPRP